MKASPSSFIIRFVGSASVAGLILATCAPNANALAAPSRQSMESTDSALSIPSDGIVDDAMPGWTWSDDRQLEDSQYHAASAHALAPGTQCSYTFHGIGIDIFALQAPTVIVDGRRHKIGALRILIDGEVKSEVSACSSSTNYDYKAFSITGLNLSNHVLQIQADGVWGVVDYLKVSTNLPQPDAPAISAQPIYSSDPAIVWSGYVWNVNRRKGIASGVVKGGLNNVYLDTDGALHLNLNAAGGPWTGAELGSSANFTFGSFYFVISGPFDELEPQDVFAAFTYGPDHGNGPDGTNEISLEFSRWNNPNSPTNGDFDIYPSPGSQKAANSTRAWTWTRGEIATCRIDWTSTAVTTSIWPGIVPIDAPVAGAAVTSTFYGDFRSIPQTPCPFFFNFRSFRTPPTKPVEITVSKFQYIRG